MVIEMIVGQFQLVDLTIAKVISAIHRWIVRQIIRIEPEGPVLDQTLTEQHRVIGIRDLMNRRKPEDTQGEEEHRDCEPGRGGDLF